MAASARYAAGRSLWHPAPPSFPLRYELCERQMRNCPMGRQMVTNSVPRIATPKPGCTGKGTQSTVQNSGTGLMGAHARPARVSSACGEHDLAPGHHTPFGITTAQPRQPSPHSGGRLGDCYGIVNYRNKLISSIDYGNNTYIHGESACWRARNHPQVTGPRLLKLLKTNTLAVYHRKSNHEITPCESTNESDNPAKPRIDSPLGA